MPCRPPPAKANAARRRQYEYVRHLAIRRGPDHRLGETGETRHTVEEIITTRRMASEGRPAMVPRRDLHGGGKAATGGTGQAAPVDMLAQKRAELVLLQAISKAMSPSWNFSITNVHIAERLRQGLNG